MSHTQKFRRKFCQQGQFHITWCKGAFNKADCFSKHHPTARHRDLRSAHLHEPPSQNSNCFGCLCDGDGDDDSDAVTAADGSAPDALHAQPKASRNLRLIGLVSVKGNRSPSMQAIAMRGEGVLIPPHSGHSSHATCACTLSRTLEQTCNAAALLRHFSAAHPL
jgi:hypothetical protein